MLIQSGGQKVYAVLAKNDKYNLGILPTVALVSATVFVSLRLRYMDELNKFFDPHTVPKEVLVSGIERSANTLRGTVLLNTGVKVGSIGKSFPMDVAEPLIKAAPGFLFEDDSCVTTSDIREDFAPDFCQLLENSLANYYPPLDLSDMTGLMDGFQLEQMKLAAAVQDKTGLTVVPTIEENPDNSNITKLSFGGAPLAQSADDDDGVETIDELNKGVDTPEGKPQID